MVEPKKRTRLRDALHHRDYRLLLVGYTISATGDWLYSVALVVYVFQVTGSPGWVAITSFVRFAPVVFLGTFGGVIADRYDRKRVMIAADLARFVVMVILTAVAAARGPAWAAALCAGAAVTFASAYRPALSAAVPALVGEDDLAAANTLSSVVENVALALGPAIGGVLLILGSPTAAFAINAATFLVSAAFTSGIRTSLVPAGEASEDTTDLRARVTAGFAAIRSSSAVMLLVIVSVAFTMLYGVEIVLYTMAAHQLLHIGDDGLAFMWTAIGLGGILAAGLTNRIAERPQLSAALGISALVSALPMMCLSFVRAEFAVYALLLVEGAAVIVADVVFITLLQRSVHGEVLGRVFGILDSLMVAGILVGSLLAPLMVAIGGLRFALVAGGSLLILVAGITLPKARAIDREAAAHAAERARIVDALGGTEIFADADRPTLEGLATATTTQHVDAGEVVIREGEPADDLFVVIAGTLHVTAVGEGREAEHVRDLGETDHFGEIGIVERRPRTATVTAATDCNLYRIAGDDFLQAVSQTPRMSGRVLHSAAARLERTHPSESLGHA